MRLTLHNSPGFSDTESMKNLRRFALLLPVFVFVSAFQNCSLHQSEGRKYVEDGRAKSAKDNNLSLSSTTPAGKLGTSCEPYINDAAASEAMGVFSSTKLVFDQSNQSVSCVVSANEASQTPALDVSVCSISAANLELMQNAPDQTMVLDPYGPLSRGSLGFSRKLSNGATQFVFVGSSDSAMEAVACHFIFESDAEFQSQSAEALERSARLVHEMYRGLR